MAENEDGQERSEDPTDDRRDLFRKRGDIAHSRELTSILTLAILVTVLSYYGNNIFHSLQKSLIIHFTNLNISVLTTTQFSAYLKSVWLELLEIIAPIFIAVAISSMFFTFVQTRMSFSLDKITPNFSKLNPLKGLTRLFSRGSLLEIFKGLAKTLIICVTSYLILFGELKKIPFLSQIPLIDTWKYWGSITKSLLYSAIGFLLFVAAIDYIYNYFTIEKHMKMTKQEVKDDYKQRELDPLIKSRMRKMQRDVASRRTVEAAKQATVIITNPTHFSVAIKYELGMRAPIVLAKGADFLALQIREMAKTMGIPIVENKPLAQALYHTIKVNHEVPESLYKAISEVISYVFKSKGIKISS